MKTWFQKYDSSLLVGKLGKRQNITEWILSVKGTLILTYLWFVQALGARCLWFYEKFWGVF